MTTKGQRWGKSALGRTEVSDEEYTRAIEDHGVTASKYRIIEARIQTMQEPHYTRAMQLFIKHSIDTVGNETVNPKHRQDQR